MYRTIVLLMLAICLSGCASSGINTRKEVPPMHSISEFRDQRFAEVEDPVEGLNRRVYQFNFYFDKYLFLPVVNSYEYVTPIFVQERVSGFYSNLLEVRNFTNSMLQLKGAESMKTLGRFVINSTIGIGGLFDPAAEIGLKRAEQDFGRTLGHWGTDSGPYLVLPLYGPSSLRDAGGIVVDNSLYYGTYFAIDPFANTGSRFALDLGFSTLSAIDSRHIQSFRYYESGYPFEYYMVRFINHTKREIEAGKSDLID